MPLCGMPAGAWPRCDIWIDRVNAGPLYMMVGLGGTDAAAAAHGEEAGLFSYGSHDDFEIDVYGLLAGTEVIDTGASTWRSGSPGPANSKGTRTCSSNTDVP